MFPKMGSCVRERVWVSLVKEASDIGGIPSPRSLHSGLGAHNEQVSVPVRSGAGLKLFQRGAKEGVTRRTRAHTHAHRRVFWTFSVLS